MKKTKLFIAATILLLFTSTLSAKDVKVNVTAFGGPLAHSYIYINGIIYETCDNLGVTYLPLSKLKIGDKISASFAGHNSVESIFDETVKNSKVMSLDLSNNFSLDVVVVKGKTFNPVKLYKKEIERHYPLYFGPFILDYDIDYKTDTENYDCSGSLTISHWYANRGTIDWYNINKVNNFKSVECNNDTTIIKRLIAKEHLRILKRVEEFDKLFREFYKHPFKITYKGISDNYRAFALSRDTKKTTYQYIFYFDLETGLVKKGEYIIVTKNEDNMIKYRSTFDFIGSSERHVFPTNIQIERSSKESKLLIKFDNVELGENENSRKDFKRNKIDLKGYERT